MFNSASSPKYRKSECDRNPVEIFESGCSKFYTIPISDIYVDKNYSRELPSGSGSGSATTIVMLGSSLLNPTKQPGMWSEILVWYFSTPLNADESFCCSL